MLDDPFVAARKLFATCNATRSKHAHGADTGGAWAEFLDPIVMNPLIGTTQG